MSKIRKTVKCFSWPILFGIGQILIYFFFYFQFRNVKIKEYFHLFKSLKKEEIISKVDMYLQTSKGSLDLVSYIQSHMILILFINFLFLVFLFKKYKNMEKNSQKINGKEYFLISFFSILLSLALNLCLPSQNTSFTFHFMIFLSTSIIGPFIEEILFRGITYNRLKNIYSKKTSIWIVSIVFALFHTYITQMLYAFIMGLYFIYLLEKYQNIKAPICGHIVSNLFVYLCMPFILKIPFSIKMVILFFLVSFFFIFLHKNYKNRQVRP